MATAIEAIRALVPWRPPHPARARIVAGRESFTGVMTLRGTCTTEQTAGPMVAITLRLDQHGQGAEGQAPQTMLTLEPRHGDRFRRNRRYEVRIRDVTDEEATEEEE